MIYLALFLLFISFIFSRGEFKRKTALLNSIVFFITLLLIVGYVFIDYLSGNGFDESVYYHLVHGVGDAGFSEFFLPIFILVVTILFSILLSYFFYHFSYGQKSGFSRNALVSIVCLVLSIAANPLFSDIYSVFNGGGDDYDEVSAGYKRVLNPEFSKKPNIVYIYIESVERTYFDEHLFPGLLPNLKEIEKKSFSFTNVVSPVGAGWTIAGMVASQCGIPLLGGYGNGLEMTNTFLPNAQCIGDILNSQGYDLSYMGGAHLRFAGKGNFYSQHGFSHVLGYDELKDKVANDYKNAWGLYDDSVFALAEEKVSELVNGKSPFGLFLLNVDTHHPKGHLSNYCKTIRYGDGSNELLNSIHCLDLLVSKFYNHVRALDPEAVVVIASDHLAMKGAITWDVLNGSENRTNFLIINNNKLIGESNEFGSTLDIAPTILSLFSDVDALGFGRSFFSRSKDSSNRIKLNSYLLNRKGVLSDLWGLSNISSGIQINQSENKVSFAGKEFELPIFFKVSDDGDVIDFMLGGGVLSEKFKGISFKDNFVLIDGCVFLKSLVNLDLNQDSEICLAYGGSKGVAARVLGPNEFVNDIEFLDHDNANYYYKYLSRIKEFGDDLYYTKHDGKDVAFLSYGGFLRGGSYFIRYNDELRKKNYFKRGLTLIAFDEYGRDHEVAWIDTCAGVERFTPLSLTITRYRKYFNKFVLVGSDSIVCGNRDVKAYIGFLELPKLESVGFRQPYVAVINGKLQAQEYVGGEEGAIQVDISIPNKKFPHKVLAHDDRAEMLPFVAHAGGEYNGKIKTNSLEALEENKHKYNLFEIDFSWTSDRQLVCIHDWGLSYENTFNSQLSKVLTLREFEDKVSVNGEFENCTLESLILWLDANPLARIVTDIKENNYDALALIAARYPEYISRFIPQIYFPFEYYSVRELGFSDIIWTLYRYSGDDVLSRLAGMDLFALTMPVSRAAGLAKTVREKTGLRSYVHKINDIHQYNQLRAVGVNSIYTDRLFAPTVEIKSAGYGGGETFVRIQSEVVSADRGSSLYGIINGQIKELGRIDFCGSVDDLDKKKFVEAFSDARMNYESIVYVVHDTAYCSNNALLDIVEYFPFEKLKLVEFRQPYIGVLSSDGRTVERLGPESGAVHYTYESPLFSE